MHKLTPESIAILKKYFIFDKIFDLFLYDLNMVDLYNELKNLKRETYENNYRFVFLHYDTEYYLDEFSSLFGVTLINLQKILRSLDIPNYFCLILTQQKLTDQLNYLKNITINDCNIATLDYFNYYAIEQFHNKIDHRLEINTDAICSTYLTLNNIKRLHRVALMSLLKEKNLLSHGLVSYNAYS